ncbi:hypothetical protein I302_107143 [Kwoniella bestiolae CBS 10118]|uniref:Uncharacterized protein n=1 Tax=Kwoniella bestiolae CBS 10118 TaxID=1296100 RepID=A0A1B9FZD3_9TREE|nr:hypothetical protein I302_05591 [Kwoniella bestiolae CBS 10118]OCF24133.1 hypothetical protein I302_05591 [Kwoniella bestiolae CBS 10118]
MLSPSSTITNTSPPRPHLAQHRRHSTSSTTSKPNAQERLSKLLSTISSVLLAYSKSPNASPRYVNSLIEFHKRAASLCPDGKGVPQLPTPPSSTPHLGVGRVGTNNGANVSFSAMLLQSHPPYTHKRQHRRGEVRRKSLSDQVTLKDIHEHDHDHPIRHLPPINKHIPEGPAGPEERDGNVRSLEERISKLEKDWWTSEIVAAWYGPTANPDLSRKLSDSSSKLPSPPITRRQSHNTTADDSPFLEGEGTARNDAEAQRRKSSFTLLSEYRKKKQRDEWLEPVLRRDASVVGLHDE